ncbi:MAG: sulfotransferase family protein [Solirubrobacterales bacterium]
MTPLRPRRGEQHPPAPFVVGVGRSGTTLLRLMLDAHPQLAIPAETQFVPELIESGRAGASRDRLAGLITGARNWGDFNLDAGELAERIGALERPDAAGVIRAFFQLYAEHQGKPRWGDKTPIYVTNMRTIGGAIGEARFVHLIRDGRDVALSRRRRGMGEGKPVADTARRWRRRIENARSDARRLRGRYLELRFEDLVDAPEPALRQICELVELDYDPAMLDYHERAGDRLSEMGSDLDARGGRRARSGAERLASHALAAEPPRPERTEAWRTEMSESDRREFEAVAGPLLADLGYDVPS